MLPALDNVLSMWFTAVPVFEWEPKPAEQPPAGDCEAAATVPVIDCSNGTPSDDEQRPGMRRVFKGYEWIPTSVWTQRESASWELVNRNQHEEDDERSALKAKPAVRQQPPQELTSTDHEIGNAHGGELDPHSADDAPDWERS